jgi:predicted CopG family antitoxin
MIHYGFVDIAIKQEVRDMLREIKGNKSYSKFISELLKNSTN